MRTVEARCTVLEDAKDEWWKLEVEALRAEMQDTMAEIKTQSSDMQELL
jgi:hypothetical protein